MSQIRHIQSALSIALQSDIETGVKWLNAMAAEKFAADFPNLSHVLQNIQDMEIEDYEDE